MRPPVESLNVAVALAVVLYEAARQRGFAAERGVQISDTALNAAAPRQCSNPRTETPDNKF